MPFIQILLTAVSLSAVAGGTWAVDRVMDRYGRIPVAEAPAAMPAPEEEDEASGDARILY
ncbi:hypothetical protein [Sphingosinicella rhizophila]|uniref:Uncharacterized protein n=1 Tax=Sphingosinicella rhizophila TaxID=3050082 RepID=A0ABU3Q8I4_9SPHN|nr:hypothetical protein [Sphingosinicella sp. GR2756]MDT9599245.1 hypothetical protein [Sphingosinicella sp. GR2756]